jgi:hypothetical protein
MLLAHVDYLSTVWQQHTVRVSIFFRNSKAFRLSRPVMYLFSATWLEIFSTFSFEFFFILATEFENFTGLWSFAVTLFLCRCILQFPTKFYVCSQLYVKKVGGFTVNGNRSKQLSLFVDWPQILFSLHNQSVAYCIQFPLFILHHTSELGKSTRM